MRGSVNNNNLTCKAPVCAKKTSVALRFRFRFIRFQCSKTRHHNLQSKSFKRRFFFRLLFTAACMPIHVASMHG